MCMCVCVYVRININNNRKLLCFLCLLLLIYIYLCVCRRCRKMESLPRLYVMYICSFWLVSSLYNFLLLCLPARKTSRIFFLTAKATSPLSLINLIYQYDYIPTHCIMLAYNFTAHQSDAHTLKLIAFNIQTTLWMMIIIIIMSVHTNILYVDNVCASEAEKATELLNEILCIQTQCTTHIYAHSHIYTATYTHSHAQRATE